MDLSLVKPPEENADQPATPSQPSEILGGGPSQGKLIVVASEVSRKPRVCSDGPTTQEGDESVRKMCN